MSEEHDTSMDQTVDEDQEVVTLKDILQSEQELMDDANAVLGAIDDKKCTYSEVTMPYLNISFVKFVFSIL